MTVMTATTAAPLALSKMRCVTKSRDLDAGALIGYIDNAIQ